MELLRFLIPSSALALYFFATLGFSFFQDVPFSKHYRVDWGYVQTIDHGFTTQLKMDRTSGGGFQSIYKYMYGYFSMKMKLVPDYSAGVVVAFYMTSLSPAHDEIDFEFLGTIPGRPWVLLTNVFTNGTGDKEQMFNLWFDPTKDFHEYSILWNKAQIVWYVDGVPIRVYRNAGASAATFPKNKALWVRGSIWSADWATMGGWVKIDWSKGPFIASYRGFGIKGCKNATSRCLSNIWWKNPSAYVLSTDDQHKYISARNTSLVYDYCTDTKRFSFTPPECLVPPFGDVSAEIQISVPHVDGSVL